MSVRFSSLQCANVHGRYNVVDGFSAHVHDKYREMVRDPSTQRPVFMIARQDAMTECRTDRTEVSIVWSLHVIPFRWLQAS